MDADREPSLATLLARLRAGAGLTQVELAARAGISRRALGDIERGVTRGPQRATIDLLADALALGPEDRDRLRAAARAGGPRPTSASAPTAAASATAAPSLPNRAGLERSRPMLGRAAEAAALRRMLLPGALVTVVGVGGVGKSRLALEALADAADAGRPVHVAALESLDTPEGALAAVAAALDAPPGAAPETLAALLAPGAVLLLDDADRVRAAAPEIAALAAAAPRATVLVTSRQPLGAPGERTLPLAPFAVDDLHDGHRAGADRLHAHPAVALFLQRAEGNAGAAVEDVARVVAALDGLPLAIELAAAQTGHLAPAAILRLLEASGVGVLARPGAAGRDRQATMAAAVAWSADLLPPAAAELLAILGAFRGGAALDALEELLVDLDRRPLLRALPDLIRSGLVHHAAGDRVAMLEPIRLYAEERLEARPDRRAIRLAHARRFAAWAERTGSAALGPEVDAALAAERADRANALLAARVAREEGAPDLAAAIVSGVWRLWEAAALHRTVAPLVEALAARPDRLSDRRLRAMVRYVSAYLAIQLGQPATVSARIAELDAGDAFDRALGALAASLTDGPDPAALEPALREAHAALAAAGHPFAWMPLLQLADAALRDGRKVEGLELLRGVLAGLEERGARFDLPPVLYPMGYTLTDLGRLPEARAVLRRDVETCLRHGFRMALLQALTAFAEACARDLDGDPALPRAGATLFGAVAAFGARVGVPESAFWRERRLAAAARLASRLPAAELARLDAEGRRLSLDEAAALALATAG